MRNANASLLNPKVVCVEQLRSGSTVVTLKGVEQVVEICSTEKLKVLFERLTAECNVETSKQIGIKAIDILVNDITELDIEGEISTHELAKQVIEELEAIKTYL